MYLSLISGAICQRVFGSPQDLYNSPHSSPCLHGDSAQKEARSGGSGEARYSLSPALCPLPSSASVSPLLILSGTTVFLEADGVGNGGGSVLNKTPSEGQCIKDFNTKCNISTKN